MAQVRAAATYALGALVTVAAESSADNTASEDDVDEYVQAAEQEIARYLLRVLSDGSPLVRAELATGNAYNLILQKAFVSLPEEFSGYRWQGKD